MVVRQHVGDKAHAPLIFYSRCQLLAKCLRNGPNQYHDVLELD